VVVLWTIFDILLTLCRFGSKTVVRNGGKPRRQLTVTNAQKPQHPPLAPLVPAVHNPVPQKLLTRAQLSPLLLPYNPPTNPILTPPSDNVIPSFSTQQLQSSIPYSTSTVPLNVMGHAQFGNSYPLSRYSSQCW